MQTTYSSSNFALAVVVHPVDGRFLIVQESAKHNYKWWLPGGRVEWGDSFATTCVKETLEEGGLHVLPTRLLKVCESGVVFLNSGLIFVTSQFPPTVSTF